MAPPTMPGGAGLLLVAVLGVTAFTPPRLFGLPRTRPQALAFAKKAVFKDVDKDSVATPAHARPRSAPATQNVGVGLAMILLSTSSLADNMMITSSLPAELVSGWLVPSFALLGFAATNRFRWQPATSDPDVLAALRCDVDSLVLSLPLCLAANALTLAAMNAAPGSFQHTATFCCALDWLMVVPAVVTARRLGASQARYLDPGDNALEYQWSTRGTPLSKEAADAGVEVREHLNGWRTLRFVSPDGRWSTQSAAQFEEGRLKPLSVANEYVKVMAVLALAILEPQPLAQPHTALFEGSLRGQDRHSRHSVASVASGMVDTSTLRPPLAPKKRRLLFLGLGAGSLPSLFASLLEPQNYELVAVELDAAVVTAAEQWLGLDCGRVHVETDNALDYVAACAVLDGGSFDAIFVDVFDRENAVPADFLSADFLINLRRCLTPEGFVITNLHTGSTLLDQQLNTAASLYRRVFRGSTCQVPVSHQGNTILAAGSIGVGAEQLQAAAAREGSRLELPFDAKQRLRRACFSKSGTLIPVGRVAPAASSSWHVIVVWPHGVPVRDEITRMVQSVSGVRIMETKMVTVNDTRAAIRSLYAKDLQRIPCAVSPLASLCHTVFHTLFACLPHAYLRPPPVSQLSSHSDHTRSVGLSTRAIACCIAPQVAHPCEDHAPRGDGEHLLCDARL